MLPHFSSFLITHQDTQPSDVGSSCSPPLDILQGATRHQLTQLAARAHQSPQMSLWVLPAASSAQQAAITFTCRSDRSSALWQCSTLHSHSSYSSGRASLAYRQVFRSLQVSQEGIAMCISPLKKSWILLQFYFLKNAATLSS